MNTSTALTIATDHRQDTQTQVSHARCATLTLWHPLLPYGYSYKASCARPG